MGVNNNPCIYIENIVYYKVIIIYNSQIKRVEYLTMLKRAGMVEVSI